MATHERYRNAQGEWLTRTQWHQLVFWGQQALYAQQRLTRGTELAIEGKLVTRQYVDKNGVNRHVTEIRVNEMLPLSSRPALES